MDHTLTHPASNLSGMHLSSAVAKAMGLGTPELMSLPNKTGYSEVYILRADACPYGCQERGCEHEHWTRSAGLYQVLPYAFDVAAAWEVLRWVGKQPGDLYYAFLYGFGLETTCAGLNLDRQAYAWQSALLQLASEKDFPAMVCRALLFAVANRHRWAGCPRPCADAAGNL